MNAVVMMLLGAGAGMGVLLFLGALRPSVQPIDEVFSAVSRPGQRYSDTAERQERSGRQRLAAVGVSLSLATGDAAQLRNDLAVTGSTLEQHGLVKAAAPAMTVLGTYVLWLLLAAVGVVISPAWAIVIGMALGACAFVIPDVRLRARAKQRRTAFRHSLSAYLDLVTIIMSGGGGLLTALQSAADAGDGWAFMEIREALDRARLSNRTPWSQLDTLATRFDISELHDLVSNVELAGSEGSRITESIATKSDVLRARLLAEVEQTSESLTEQMLVPIGLLLVALFLFLGFAIFQQVGVSPPPESFQSSLGMVNIFGLRGG